MNIKERIKQSGLNQWEVAEKIKISEFTLSRWLRRPEKLDKEITDSINSAINELTKKEKGGEI